MSSFTKLVPILTVALAVSAHAEVLDLQECLKLAQEKSIDSIQAAMNATLAQQEYLEASRNVLPYFLIQSRMANSNLGPDNLSDANRATVRVEQKINPFSSDWKRIEQKHLLHEVAKLQKIETKQDVDLAVKQLFYAILKKTEFVDRLDLIEKLVKRLHQTVIPKFNVTKKQPFDIVKVKIAATNIERDKFMLNSELEGQKSKLIQMLGLDLNIPYRFRFIEDAPVLPPVESYLNQTEKNPTLIVLAQKSEAADAAVSVARGNRMGDILGGLDYGYGSPIGGTGGTYGYELSVAVRFPLFDWGTISSQIEQQKIAAQLAKTERDKERQKTISAIIETHTRAHAEHTLFKKLTNLLPPTLESANNTVDRYRAGGAMILEAVDSIDLWMQTLLAERGAFYSYLDDYAVLERLVGELNASK